MALDHEYVQELTIGKATLSDELEDIHYLGINDVVLLQQRILTVEGSWASHSALVWFILKKHESVFESLCRFRSKV